jgi:phospholipase C
MIPRIATICWFLFAMHSLHAAGMRPAPEQVQFSSEQIAASQKIKYFIIIFQENWSFDSLYGTFSDVNGLNSAPVENTRQVDTKGIPYRFLPPCVNTNTNKVYSEIPSLPNAPFNLEPYIPPNRATGDLVHRFYQEISQINGGKMNAFANYSDAKGLSMSYYDISQTRLGKLSQQYTICDNFFHSCYGGSMCGVIWLFSARMPTWPQAPKELIAKVRPDGTLIKDGVASADGYAINDAQPFYPPYQAGIPDKHRVPPQSHPTIGDLLTQKGISWGWFAEGWDDALNGHPAPTFEFHHQAPSYFKQFAPGTQARKDHLLDLNTFYELLDQGNIPAISFIRSLDKNSMHPGDSNLATGLEWTADLVERIQNSSIWNECAIVISYDENGGRWDHVPPPQIDEFGPATRIPTVIISPYAKRQFVDHTCYETVSILKFIEQRWGIPPLTSRDAQANNLLNAFDFGSEMP